MADKPQSCWLGDLPAAALGIVFFMLPNRYCIGNSGFPAENGHFLPFLVCFILSAFRYLSLGHEKQVDLLNHIFDRDLPVSSIGQAL
jgi:hypothetical protein